MSSKEQALSSIDDLRDVSVALRLRAGRSIIREGLLYLSGPVKDATEVDNSRLRNEYAIKTLVDHGSRRRLRAFPGDFTPGNPPQMEWKMVQFGIVKVMGIQYCWSSLTPNAYVKALQKRLSFWKKAKSAHYVLSDQLDKMGDIYAGVVDQRGMDNDTFDRLEHAQPEICELFNRVLSHRASYPVLISSLPLTNEAVERAGEKATSMAAKHRHAEILQSRARWATAVRDHLDSRFGGAEGYLESAGVTLASRDAIKHILLADADEGLVDAEGKES